MIPTKELFLSIARYPELVSRAFSDYLRSTLRDLGAEDLIEKVCWECHAAEMTLWLVIFDNEPKYVTAVFEAEERTAERFPLVEFDVHILPTSVYTQDEMESIVPKSSIQVYPE